MQPSNQGDTGGGSSSSLQVPAAGQLIGLVVRYQGEDRLVLHTEEEETDEDTEVKAEGEDDEGEEEELAQVKEEQDEPSSKRRRTDAK